MKSLCLKLLLLISSLMSFGTLAQVDFTVPMTEKEKSYQKFLCKVDSKISVLFDLELTHSERSYSNMAYHRKYMDEAIIFKNSVMFKIYKIDGQREFSGKTGHDFFENIRGEDNFEYAYRFGDSGFTGLFKTEDFNISFANCRQ